MRCMLLCMLGVGGVGVLEVPEVTRYAALEGGSGG